MAHGFGYSVGRLLSNTIGLGGAMIIKNLENILFHKSVDLLVGHLDVISEFVYFWSCQEER